MGTENNIEIDHPAITIIGKNFMHLRNPSPTTGFLLCCIVYSPCLDCNVFKYLRSRAYKRDRDSSYRYDNRNNYHQEERPPKRQDSHEHSRISHIEKEKIKSSAKKEVDSFWDTKWEAMELQKKADLQNQKGKHFLDEEQKKKRSKEREDGTPSLSPENRTPSPECDELKRINKMKQIQVNLKLKHKIIVSLFSRTDPINISIFYISFLGFNCTRIRKICG